MSDDFNPSELNLSELAAIAAHLNSEVHRQIPREFLEVMVTGEDLDLPERTLNKKRLLIMQRLNENWGSYRDLLDCPAKTRDPKACFNCSDLQVSSCLLDNRKIFEKRENKP